ncbi:hypothetical protein VP01_1458g4 [Puccinia sorghi]|uniref:Uncharacterized protein n=1 Tax=Puccinia sorghi TaxID=27349 RepID=A0A0L6VJV2_9BASI|nr:hypothetical protein VP01_1458g4 [Puccinia sorghi]
MLLHRTGATSFEDLRTVNGLLISDAQGGQSLKEAALWMFGKGLRQMIAIILANCDPADPQRLLNNSLEHLSDDCLRELQTKFPDITPSNRNPSGKFCTCIKSGSLRNLQDDSKITNTSSRRGNQQGNVYWQDFPLLRLKLST